MPARWLPLLLAATAALCIVPGVPATVSKTLVVALGVCVLGALGVSDGQRGRAFLATPLGLWGILSIWVGLGLVWGNPGGLPRVLLLGLGWCFAATVAQRLAAGSRRALVEEVGAIVGLASSGAVAVGRVLGTDLGAWVFGNENWLGVALCLSLATTVGAVLSKSGRSRWRWGVIALAQALALGVTPSRVAWVAAVAAGVTLVAWHRWCRGRAQGRALAARRLATGVVGLSLSLTAVGVGMPRGAATVAGSSTSRALEGRSWIWKISATAASRAPVLGRGSGSFGHAFLGEQGGRLAGLSEQTASRRFVNATTAHNDFLHLAVELGFLASVLLAGFLWLLLRRALDRSPAQSAMLAALAICMVGESCLTQPVPVVFLALSTAALSPRPARVMVMGSFATGALGAALLVQAFLSERALSEADARAGSERLGFAMRAASVDPRSGAAALTHGLALLELGRAREARRELERSRVLLANVGTHVALGNAYQELGELRAALASYRVALSYHPALLKALANETVVLTRLQRLPEARRSLRRAQQLWPGHAALPPIEEALRRAELNQATGASAP